MKQMVKIGMLKKQKLYQQEGKRLISLHFSEKDRLRELLAEKLGRYVRLPAANEAQRSQAGRQTPEAGGGDCAGF